MYGGKEVYGATGTGNVPIHPLVLGGRQDRQHFTF